MGERFELMSEPVCIVWGDQNHLAPADITETYCALSANRKCQAVHVLPRVGRLLRKQVLNSGAEFCWCPFRPRIWISAPSSMNGVFVDKLSDFESDPSSGKVLGLNIRRVAAAASAFYLLKESGPRHVH